MHEVANHWNPRVETSDYDSAFREHTAFAYLSRFFSYSLRPVFNSSLAKPSY